MVKPAKLLISLWLVYHLFIVALFPNTQSLLSRKLDKYLLPYANMFNMNTPWQFFSPFPGPKMYLEYEVSQTQMSDSGTTEVESKKYYWPPLERGSHDWDNFRRRIYSSRFLAMDERRLKDAFVPWICRLHPEAMMASVEIVMAPVPNIEKASRFSRIENMETPSSSYKLRADCPTKAVPDEKPHEQN